MWERMRATQFASLSSEGIGWYSKMVEEGLGCCNTTWTKWTHRLLSRFSIIRDICKGHATFCADEWLSPGMKISFNCQLSTNWIAREELLKRQSSTLGWLNYLTGEDPNHCELHQSLGRDAWAIWEIEQVRKSASEPLLNQCHLLWAMYIMWPCV